jgi:hypothetical protein
MTQEEKIGELAKDVSSSIVGSFSAFDTWDQLEEKLQEEVDNRLSEHDDLLPSREQLLAKTKELIDSNF